jgi:predicted HTH domain antitoxin
MGGTTRPSLIDQLQAPYAERWELLKDVMVRLYMKEKKTVKKIAEFMEMEYKFFASSVFIVILLTKLGQMLIMPTL